MVSLLAPCGQKNKFSFLYFLWVKHKSYWDFRYSRLEGNLVMVSTRFLFTQFIPRIQNLLQQQTLWEALWSCVLSCAKATVTDPTYSTLRFGLHGIMPAALRLLGDRHLPSLSQGLQTLFPPCWTWLPWVCPLPSTWGHSEWTLSWAQAFSKDKKRLCLSPAALSIFLGPYF